MSHDEATRALRAFLGELAGWSDLLKREPWGQTDAGHEAAEKVESLATLAQDEATKLAGKRTLLEAYTRTKVLSFAETAEKIAASCPAGPLRETPVETSRRLRSAFP